MAALGAAATERARVYFTGGATAVLMGWRSTTIDIDLKVVPEHDALLRAIPALKDELRVNVELAAPSDFIPISPGWEDRGVFIGDVGRISFFHFDLYAQALAKVERGHAQDLADVGEMVKRGLVEPAKAVAYFTRIESDLHRFPAIHPPAFRRAVERAFDQPTD